MNLDMDKLSRLARLELKDTQGLAGDLQDLVYLANQLDALDLSGEEYGDCIPLQQLREDCIQPFSGSTAELLANAPRRKDGCIAVPKVEGV